MIKETITISITPEEKMLAHKLKEERNITQVAIFRMGLNAIKQTLVVDLTQNNNS